MVGVYALELLNRGVESSPATIMSCLELRLQVYNSKLHFPSSKTNAFNHLDGDVSMANMNCPAPQSLVAMSPNFVDAEEIWRVRFVNVGTPEHKSRIVASMAYGAKSYEVPRTANTPVYGARDSPAYVQEMFAKGNADHEPSSINMFDVLIFTHLACHEFTQFAVGESNSRKYESIRQAEFLFLMSPRLHGVLHQSVGEVVRATGDGKPPDHWCHFYTGNSMRHKSGKHLEPVCPPLPWAPPTQLARCLMGADNWVEFPSVLTWSVDIASGKSSLEVALALPLAEHRAACADRIAALHQRVTQLSSPSSELCTTMALRLASGEALTSLAMHPEYMEVTCQAATSFLDSPLWTPTSAELSEQGSDRDVIVTHTRSLSQNILDATACASELVVECLAAEFLPFKPFTTSQAMANVDETSNVAANPGNSALTNSSVADVADVTSSDSSEDESGLSDVLSRFPAPIALPIAQPPILPTVNKVFPVRGSDSCLSFLLSGLSNCNFGGTFCVVVEPTSDVVDQVRVRVEACTRSFGLPPLSVCPLNWVVQSLNHEPKVNLPPPAQSRLKDELRLVGSPDWFSPEQRNAIAMLVNLTAAQCVIDNRPLSCMPLSVRLDTSSRNYRKLALVDKFGWKVLQTLAGTLNKRDLHILISCGAQVDAFGGVLQKLQGHNLVTLPPRGTRAIGDLSGDQLTAAVLRVCMGSSSNVGGASTSTVPPERPALIDLYQSLHGSTGDSSSKDSSEEMESFGTLTHGALQSDLHILLFAHFFLLHSLSLLPSSSSAPPLSTSAVLFPFLSRLSCSVRHGIPARKRQSVRNLAEPSSCKLILMFPLSSRMTIWQYDEWCPSIQ